MFVHYIVVRPATVLRWHRQGRKLLWRRRSRRRIGQPQLSAGVRDPTVTMARDNPLWGSERIRGELPKLGITVSKRLVRRHRRRGPAGPSSQTWRTFLASQAGTDWAAALFAVQTLTSRPLYGHVFIGRGRRELSHVDVTVHPTAAWVLRQLVESTAWGRRPRFLFRGRDAVFGGDFAKRKPSASRPCSRPCGPRGRTRSRSESSAPSGGSASIIWSC
jgi:hypothetical protein